ncbi:hypothetical protein HYU15_01805 [Candidatus Woesearchaeota archaeon]|nr:hypothetical protein [Candidatus Woesearchaeota archaeon]
MAAIEPVTFHWQGISRLEDIFLETAPSTFNLSAEQKLAAKRFWEEEQERNPGKLWNGQLWRYEQLYDGNELTIAVSQIMYHTYHYKQGHMRDSLFPNPNPLGVAALQVTADGYILAGIQEHSGRDLLTLLGSGLVERGSNDKITDTFKRELYEETAYPKGFTPETEKAAAISIQTGKGLQTTGISVYMPLPLAVRDVGIGSNEHRELVPIPLRDLNEVINKAGYKDVKASAQLLGTLITYALLRENLAAKR